MRCEPWKEAPKETLTVVVSACVCVCARVCVVSAFLRSCHRVSCMRIFGVKRNVLDT